MPAKFSVFLSLFLSLYCRLCLAQTSLQTPSQFLGYELGTRFTRHSDIVRYLEYAARQAPDRIKLQPYGTTYEGRPLYLAFVASPENMSRLEEIRTNHLRQIGLAPGTATASGPAIAWLSYNVHGNEAVSSEAVLQVLYDLLNSANAQTQQWLRNTVVLLDPCVNPDGRERYVQWYGQVTNQEANVQPYAREHQEPWPGGRFNHYLFDLNRDWAWQTQKESQQRIAVYNQWMPHLHADFHEMSPNAPYYFSPAAKPFHEDITPWQRTFQGIIGENNRKYFDANNWLYFTRETYDLFYPSYGDTWPTFNGAIAMTYEQGGSGRAGLALLRPEGDTLTLAQRITHHHTASLATLEALSEKSSQVIQEFQKYYQRNRTKPAGTYKTFVFKAKGHEATVKALTAYLDRQQIQYGYATGNSSERGFNYVTGKTESAKVEKNDLVISMYQPKSTLVKVLFEPATKLEDSLTYDITSWALPYAYGIPAFAFRGQIKQTTKAPDVATAAPINIAKPYAFLARWGSLEDVKFLSALLKQQIKVRFTEKPFETEGRKYNPGTLIITRAGNQRLGDRFDAVVQQEAERAGVTLIPANTGFVSSGADFGSASVHALKMPRVAVLAGPTISPTGFGEVWHFFEQQINYPVTVIETNNLSQVPFSNFDVLILPGGSYNDVFPEKIVSQLKDWIREGGKLIALESATGFFAGKRDFALIQKKAPDSVNINKNPYALLRPYGETERQEISDQVLGGVYRVSLDTTHPLAYGYKGPYFALMQNASNYQFMKTGWNVGVLKKDISASGFVGVRARKKLQDTLVLGHQPMGKGSIIYLADNPLFRAFWHSGKLLFGNAVFLVGQ